MTAAARCGLRRPKSLIASTSAAIVVTGCCTTGGEGRVSVKMNSKLYAAPDVTVVLLITNGQSSPIAKLFVLVGAKMIK